MARTYRESIEKKREDAKEMMEILEKIPRERKPEALARVKGFALCAELDEKKVGCVKRDRSDRLRKGS